MFRNYSMFMLFLINMILPVTTCVLAYLGCYTMAGWCLVGAILSMSTPSRVIHTDTPEEMKKLLNGEDGIDTEMSDLKDLEKRVEKLEKALGESRIFR